MPSAIPILYLSHDGMLEPLGESQVLAYLERLAGEGAFSLSLISFEKAHDFRNETKIAAMRARLGAAGIAWYPLTYHNRPPFLSTLYDLARGYLRAREVRRERGFRVVHARSYPMALLALWIKRRTGASMIFDMRGFWADERAESGTWSRGGAPYRFFKSVERRALLGADAIVSLTSAAVHEIRRFPYMSSRPARFEVIPTCADLEIFRPGTGVPAGRFTLGYVGSTGLWYDFAPVARAFGMLRELRPDARLLLLTRDPEGPLREALHAFPADAIEIRQASRRETAEAMRSMHLTAFFLKPSYAKTASMPTKLGEFLGSGVPCLTNTGCGDLAEFFANEPSIGRAVRDPSSDEELRAAVEAVVALAENEAARARCRRVAEAKLGLTAGADAYAALYREVGLP
jgi:glycosyltransferase involved in cell wall biosynthesis